MGGARDPASERPMSRSSADVGPVGSSRRRALVLSGGDSGRYSDPWHPFAKTSQALSDLLRADGYAVEVREDVDEAVRDLQGVQLIVANLGDSWRNGSSAAHRDIDPEALRSALERGVGLLAMHSSVGSLREYPEWAAAIGAVWLPGISTHPPIGETVVSVLDDGSTFTVVDERYTRLQFIGESDVHATHTFEGLPTPTAWTRQHRNSRVAVDVLGHDSRSYLSQGHQQLIRGLVRWAVGDSDRPVADRF
ncbi:ThuA domain-containing protein [Microbacterium immunditiarum]